jgi:hypothetical protein
MILISTFAQIQFTIPQGFGGQISGTIGGRLPPGATPVGGPVGVVPVGVVPVGVVPVGVVPVGVVPLGMPEPELSLAPLLLLEPVPLLVDPAESEPPLLLPVWLVSANAIFAVVRVIARAAINILNIISMFFIFLYHLTLLHLTFAV